MKKYLAAAVVAVMVFAFAAFAASLNVGDSVLAAGQGDVGTCSSDDVPVHSWGAEIDSGETQWVIFDRDDFTDCLDSEDHVIFVQVHDEGGTEVGRSGEISFDDIPAHAERLRVDFQTPYPLTEDIYEIRVLVHTKSL